MLGNAFSFKNKAKGGAGTARAGLLASGAGGGGTGSLGAKSSMFGPRLGFAARARLQSKGGGEAGAEGKEARLRGGGGGAKEGGGEGAEQAGAGGVGGGGEPALGRIGSQVRGGRGGGQGGQRGPVMEGLVMEGYPSPCIL